jgi:hypothetical protein
MSFGAQLRTRESIDRQRMAMNGFSDAQLRIIARANARPGMTESE